MAEERVLELLRRDVSKEEYQAVRAEWKRHSIAEDERDIAGLISTLTADCRYEVFPGGHTWSGHSGAERFYTQLLTAFPDIKFDLTNIVIGPQGVCEEAKVSGTHLARWLDFPASGNRVEFTVVIFFPWDREKRKFKGERVYFQLSEIANEESRLADARG
jgi:predicted ester cyclase